MKILFIAAWIFLALSVNGQNQPPIANAGQDVSLIWPVNTVTLQGSGFDPDGTIASYRWSVPVNPGLYSFTFSSAYTTSPVITNLQQGNYVFRLHVTDNQGAESTDDVGVIVTTVIDTGSTNLPVILKHLLIEPDQDSLLTIKTKKGPGDFYHTLDQNYINPDGQVDAVYQIGYNQNGAGGKVNPDEASIHLAIESHYQRYGGADPEFEVHLEGNTKSGLIQRYMSWNISKSSGNALGFMQFDGLQFFPSGVPMGPDTKPFMLLNKTGQVTIQGPQSILNLSAGSAGFFIQPINDGSGLTQFVNYGTGFYPAFSFESPVIFNSSKVFNGNGVVYTFNADGTQVDKILEIEHNRLPLVTFYKNGMIQLHKIKAAPGTKYQLVVDEYGVISSQPFDVPISFK